ncbi:MAG: endolytic transglycosylase MltG [Coriobacteriia bacterium]|nr:endolytic transglycosylase MltG [Coriobacteriia bacterium]
MPLRKNVTYSSRPNHAARAAHARGDRQFRKYDTSYIQPKKTKGPVVFVAVVAVLIIALVAGIFMFMGRGNGGNTYDLAEQGTQVQVTINEGSVVADMASALGHAGLISSDADFVKRVSDLGLESELKPGTYQFTAGQDVDSIISNLQAGPGMGASVTVPEGYTLAKIAAAVEEASQGQITAKAFKKAAKKVSKYEADYAFLKGVSSLEGFLFPKTYELGEAPSADSLIRQMLDQYQTEVAALDYSYPRHCGLNQYQALILASIVEKESDENTRDKVASVFYNRLSTEGEPSYGYLQSDATTAYEVGHDPTAEEVHANTPYSTYAHAGLPPTPICSPGLESLKAVCSPNKEYLNGGYYYFYFKPDSKGKMQYYFSHSLEEHNQAIANA